MAQNTAKPIDVVILAKNNETPARCNARCKDAIFPLPLANSVWYLFKMSIQLGTPITIIKGGINPARTDNLNPNNTIVHNVVTTPKTMTSSENITG